MIKRLISAGAACVPAVALMVMPSMAASPTNSLTPWVYNPGNVCDVVSQPLSATSVRLEKNCPTPTNASAGATVNGVDGLSTTGLTLSFDYASYCGAGAPRFNVYLSDGSTIFLGCVYGDPTNSGTATFTAGNTYGGVLFPTGATVTGIDIVQDEQGQVTISNVTVNGQAVNVSNQLLKNACKNGGYVTLTDSNGNAFRNQGDCVSFFATNGRNLANTH